MVPPGRGSRSRWLLSPPVKWFLNFVSTDCFRVARPYADILWLYLSKSQSNRNFPNSGSSLICL